MDIIMIMGPPGSGKGTYSQKLAAQYGYTHISSGDLLRARAAVDDELGREVKALMDQNIILPGELVTKLIAEKLEGENRTVILDGYPRSVDQAQAFEAVMQEKGYNLKSVIVLHAEFTVLAGRILARARNDIDRDEAKILKRFHDYSDITAPVISYYEAQGKVKMVASEGTIEESMDRVKAALGSLKFEWRKYALMNEETRVAVYSEIVSAVAPREGPEYIAALKAAYPDFKLSSESEEAAEINTAIHSMSNDAFFSTMSNITKAFNQQALEPDVIHKAYADNREFNDKHYDGQLKTGDNLSAEEKLFNVTVRMRKAVHAAYIERLLAHTLK